MDAERIAAHARMYRLLADRLEYGRPDVVGRVSAAVDAQVRLGLVDEALIALAGETERLCGQAVRTLRTVEAPALLDTLGALLPARLVAMYLALPDDRREAVLSDPVWAYHVGHGPLEEAEERLAEKAAEADAWARLDTATETALAHGDDARQLHKFGREFRRFVLEDVGAR